jgi:uncharacterized OB-fold protein
MTDRDFTHHTFLAHLSEHRLMGTRCLACGGIYLPPRPLCTRCYSIEMEWAAQPVEGTLTAFTTIHIAPSAMITAGYGRDHPYCSGIVRLENGLSISAQILGVDAGQPETIQVGAPVRAEFLERGEGDAKKTVLAFRVLENTV